MSDYTKKIDKIKSTIEEIREDIQHMKSVRKYLKRKMKK